MPSIDVRGRVLEVKNSYYTARFGAQGQTDHRLPGAARRAGYRSGYTTSGALVRAEDDPYLLGRWTPPDSCLALFKIGPVMRLARGCWPRLETRARARRR